MKTEIAYEYWAETIAAILMITGFLVALITGNAWLNYAVAVIAGMLSGRVYYEKHITQPILPFILMIAGFLLGFMLGAITANKLALLLLFGGSFYLSNWAHKKGHLELFRFKGHLK